MKLFNEHRCRGSLDLLKNREMEQLARNIRFGLRDYASLDEPESEEEKRIERCSENPLPSD